MVSEVILAVSVVWLLIVAWFAVDAIASRLAGSLRSSPYNAAGARCVGPPSGRKGLRCSGSGCGADPAGDETDAQRKCL